jgi:hypothetical protein
MEGYAMQKGVLISLGILFAVAVLINGCSKPEEKKAPAVVQKQNVEQKAPAAKQEMTEKAEATAETATITDQAVETAKEMGKQMAEEAIEKLPEEVQQAVDVAKEYSKAQMEQAATEEAQKAIRVEAPKDTGASLEQTMKDKAVQEGMKLPGKF